MSELSPNQIRSIQLGFDFLRSLNSCELDAPNCRWANDNDAWGEVENTIRYMMRNHYSEAFVDEFIRQMHNNGDTVEWNIRVTTDILLYG